MTHRVVFGALLVLGVLLASSAATQLQDGIPVRRVSDVGNLERLQIAVTRALIPGSKVIAPLYAYDFGDLRDQKELQQELGNSGPAAVVVDMRSRGIHAFYYQNIGQAIEAMENDSRFQNNEDRTLHLATTYPLEGGFTETGRFLSRDVERVEAQLQQQD